MKVTNKNLKIALACPGVGLVQRGFERMFLDIFNLVKDDVDITLFKGGGEQATKERRLLFITRNGLFLKILPIHKLIGRTTIHVECFTFAISLLLAIRGKGYTVIHCTDPPLARILYKLRKIFGLNIRLLYSEACAMPPPHYPPADHMQQISQISYQDALAQGIPEKYMTVLPLGTYPEKFHTGKSRRELRKEFEVNEDTFVILVLAAINRNHKRIDYILEELSSLDRDILLWIDGSLDQGDPDLIDIGKKLLGKRLRISHVPSNKVGELFEIADMMVHASVFEAFGLALIEAASYGLPVLTHNAPHFVWLFDNPPNHIDMSVAGSLREAIGDIMNDRQKLEGMKQQEIISNRFCWWNLKQDYIDIYHKVMSLPDSEIAMADTFGLR